MRIIIGLGNPGKEYDSTRHNVGFMLADDLREKWSFPEFESSKRLNAEISKGTRDGKGILLAKPQTFMNLSGESAKALLDFYKLTPDDLIVIHDDLDIPLGQFRVVTDSSAAGHNGVKDIIEKIGTQKFGRIRIGIRSDHMLSDGRKLDAKDFVMGKLSEEESDAISGALPSIIGKIQEMTASD